MVGRVRNRLPPWESFSGETGGTGPLALPNVTVRGLMTLPPFTPDSEDARPFFRKLRELRDTCRERTSVDLSDLSMGMSGDFEVAVEEGATWVRLGSVLFGKRTGRAWRPEGDDGAMP